MNRTRRFSSVAATLMIFSILGLLLSLPAYASQGLNPVGGLAIDPLDPMTLYAGTGGGGIFKSTDGGATWNPTGLTNVGVSSLAVAPRADAAEPTTLFAATHDGAVFRSSDGGATWSVIFSGSDYPWVGVSAGILDLAIDPLAPNVLAFGTQMITGWFEDGEGWTVEGAVFVSTDGGTTWNVAAGGQFHPYNCGLGPCELQPGLCDTGCDSFSALAFAPRSDSATPITLYAGTWSGTVYEIVGGAWNSSRVSPGINCLAIDPRTPTTLYAGTYKSTDAGRTWSATGLTGFNVLSLAIDPQTPTTLYAATEGGVVFKSRDGGSTWSATGLTGVNVFSLTINPEAPTTLYAGTNMGVYRSADGGATWSATGFITWSHIDTVSIDPATVTAGMASTGRVTLSGEAPAGGAVVALSSSDAWAATVPTSVTVPAGSTSAQFTISTNPAAASITVTMSAVYGGFISFAPLTVTVATTLSSVSLTPTSVIAGSISTGTLILSAAAPVGGMTVALSTSDPAVAAIPGSVMVEAGAASATFTIVTTAVNASTTVTIGASVSGAIRFALLSVNPRVTVTSMNLSPTTVAGGTASIGTVILNAPAPPGGAGTALSTSDVAIAAVPASVTVAAGATSATFTIVTTSCSSGTVTISAGYGGVSRSAALTVTTMPDTVAIQAADYFRKRQLLRVDATSTSSTATLSAFESSSGAFIGTLAPFNGSTRRGEFSWPVNPQNITLRSDRCGVAASNVSVK